MFKCSLDKLNDVFFTISNNYSLYLPVDNKDYAEYKKWEEGVKLSERLNTNKSPKDFFFPQTEDLVNFKTQGKNIEILDLREECEDFVIFGVRACDVKSFEILDRVFLTEPFDSYYANRRNHAVIVSLACTKPSESCFCNTFSIDATSPSGDVVCYIENDEIFFDAKTKKGEKLISLISSFLTECDSSVVEAQKERTREIMKKLPLANLSAEKFGSGKTNEFFDSPKWDELSQSCLGCGTCTFVCPTCQCYDIKDFNTGNKVIRYRCWDSCMYSDFTKMAHGNSRNSQKERFRQRFMHKLVYYPTNNDGLFSCVGCGRCLNRCPISMNIVKVMKELGGN